VESVAPTFAPRRESFDDTSAGISFVTMLNHREASRPDDANATSAITRHTINIAILTGKGALPSMVDIVRGALLARFSRATSFCAALMLAAIPLRAVELLFFGVAVFRAALD
jgi:hypothetical protein